MLTYYHVNVAVVFVQQMNCKDAARSSIQNHTGFLLSSILGGEGGDNKRCVQTC